MATRKKTTVGFEWPWEDEVEKQAAAPIHFSRAPVVGDSVVIAVGVRTFIDHSQAKVEAGAVELFKHVPQDLVRDIVSNGRGQVMISFAARAEEIGVPISVAGAATGPFYILPGSMTLNEAATALYGENHSEPMGFFDWLAEASPSVFGRVQELTEDVK